MIKAIESANSLDRKSITDSLAKVTVTGITGKIAFDPYGNLIKPPYTLFQVQQGQGRACGPWAEAVPSRVADAGVAEHDAQDDACPEPPVKRFGKAQRIPFVISVQTPDGFKARLGVTLFAEANKYDGGRYVR
jgi:hypothetical protein